MKITVRGFLRWLPIALRRSAPHTLAAASVLTLCAPAASAQGGRPHLHVNTRWDECSFQLDSSLTQSAWRQFTGESGVVTYFRPLVSAEPMGAGKFEVSLLQWKTGIDDSDAAWNDTFVHPDSSHWLFEGSGLAFPGFTVRAGVTDRTDVGAYFTKNPRANYGFYGAQVQHNLIHDTARNWSASARMSFVSLYGPEDLDFTVYGMDLVASRKYALRSARASIAPYAGISGSLSRSHEKAQAVNLRDENIFGAQATLGAVARLSVATLGVEYAVARVSSLSMKVGVAR
jgi:hypothetical protein